VHAWAAEGDWDPALLRSNEFELEWPPRSGRLQSFPEVDRAAWFGMEEARAKLLRGQVPFLDELAAKLGRG
jgi:predicted NUDIX family NTP pyrophosphohydrolase